MFGNTVTQSTTPTEPITSIAAPASAGVTGRTLTQSRAARELGLKRSEFDLAVQLGRVRTVVDEGGGARRVPRAEIDRLRAEQGFPEALRKRVETVGSTEAAGLLDVTAARFMRLARLGLIAPVTYHLNRYRVVVWLYLAEELRQFAADEKNTLWLKGRIPEKPRDQLDGGLDLRPRNWRGRHLGFLLRQADDPWTQAAASASLLDPVQVAEIVQDPYERAYLNRHRPARADHGTPDSPAARITARIMLADDPDEIEWLRADLQQALAAARAHRLAPRPRRKEPPRTATVGHETPPVGVARPTPHLPEDLTRPGKQPTTATGSDRRRGLLGWLRRRTSPTRGPGTR